MHPEDLLDVLPAYKGSKRMISRRQDTFDIIREILRKHKDCVAHYDDICAPFWKGNTSDTAKDLYYYAKKHLPYKVEPTLQQTVKTPAAILEERRDFGNDCKHYASFIVGIGEALRRRGYPIKCFYRFGSYNKNRKNPGHVFAVFVDKGREIWIDPVPDIGGFDRRAITPAYITDKMPPMSKNGNSISGLYDISGIGDYALENGDSVVTGLHPDQLISGHRKRGHWLDKAFDSPLNPLHPGMYTPGAGSKLRHAGHHGHHGHHGGGAAAVERVRQQMNIPGHSGAMLPGSPHDHGHATSGIGKAKKKKGLHLKIKVPKIKVPKIKIQPGKLLLKVAGAPSRNAYLLLLKLNTFHMAIKIWQKAAHDKNSAAWKNLAGKWKKLGGNENNLYNAVKQGVNTYNKLHKSKKHISGFEVVNGFPYLSGADDSDTIGCYHDNMSVGDILAFVHENHNARASKRHHYRGHPMHHHGHHGHPMHAHHGQHPHGHDMGVVQVAAAAGVIAAAAPIIKALSGLLKSFGVDTKKADDSADADLKNLSDNHNDDGSVTTNEDGTTVHADGSETQVTNNQDGTQTVTIKKVPGIPHKDDGATGDAPDGGGDDDGGETTTVTKTKTKTVTKSEEGGDSDDDPGDVHGGTGFKDMLHNVTSFVSEHKTWFIVGGVVVAAMIILPKVLSHKPKRRR